MTCCSRGATTASRSNRSTAGRCGWSSRSATSGRARSGRTRSSSWITTSAGSGRCAATTTTRSPGKSSATPGRSDRKGPSAARTYILTAMPIKVVLAEDNYLVREGVKRLLETEPALNLVAAVEDFPGLMKAVEEHAIRPGMDQGKNNAAIAAPLVLTERAVEKHINSIFSKLALSEEKDVHRRVKAVLMFLGQI